MFGDGNWLPHGFKRAPSLFRAQAALGWGVAVALMTLLGVVYLTLGSDSVVAGYHIQQMTWKLTTLQRENAQLEAEIAEFGAVRDLQNRARAMGFVPAGPEEIEYLRVDNYPPTPGDGVPEPTRKEPDSIGARESWWRRLTVGFTGWTQSTTEAAAGGRNVDH
jgi:hypothetical protein